MSHPQDTIIIGTGIIGLSIAHYLSQSLSPSTGTIILLDSSPELFASASGNAGGFLAADWFGPSVASLGALSFRLHAELAAEHGGRERWGYCSSTGLSLSTSVSGERGDDWLRDGRSRAEGRVHEFTEGEGPAWLVDGGGAEVVSRSGTAQVDPRRLCEFLLGECLARGVSVEYPVRVGSAVVDGEGVLRGVKISAESGEREVLCSHLVITAGAWSGKVFEGLFPGSKTKLLISSLAGHSIVVRSPRWRTEDEEKGCHAVFATDTEGFSPEIFSRIGREIYIAGLNDSSLSLPKVASESKPDPESIVRLKRVATRMLGVPGAEDDLEIVREGLCFRPVARGFPIVSRVPDKMLGDVRTRTGRDGGVFLAAGMRHGPWGIAQSLGTGKVMSELLEGKETSADIRGLALR